MVGEYRSSGEHKVGSISALPRKSKIPFYAAHFLGDRLKMKCGIDANCFDPPTADEYSKVTYVRAICAGSLTQQLKSFRSITRTPPGTRHRDTLAQIVR